MRTASSSALLVSLCGESGIMRSVGIIIALQYPVNQKGDRSEDVMVK